MTELLVCLALCSWAAVHPHDAHGQVPEHEPPISAEPGTAAYQQLKQQRVSSQTGTENADQNQRPSATPADTPDTGPRATNSGLIVPLDDTFEVALPANDDGSTAAIDLGFDFNFYGTIQNSVYINNNGNLSFGAPQSAFTAVGFPSSSFVMVAPFWGDVDTRADGSGVVYFRLDEAENRLIVTWHQVGYYSSQDDKLNTFQAILSTKEDPLTTVGKNVCLAYGDMQWTTGSASGGTNGFGGTPATVGLNKGDGTTFAQLGRFDEPGDAYDGPSGDSDGIDYLDGRQVCFDATQDTNLPPVVSENPSSPVEVQPLETVEGSVRLIGPENDQTVSLEVDADVPNFTADVTDGNPAIATFSFSPTAEQTGQEYTVTFRGTDDGDPVQTTEHVVTFAVGGESSFGVTDVSPRYGAAGTPVRLHGTGFAPTASENTVTFGGTVAPVDSAKTNVIYTTVPDGVEGPVPVSVTRSGVTTTATQRFGGLTGGAAAFGAPDVGLSGVDGASDAADIDGDGDLDVVGVGRNAAGEATATLYRNDGQGQFTAVDAGLTGVLDGGDAAWGDVDQDGDPDLVITGETSDGIPSTTLYENDGTGALTPTAANLTGLAASAAAWGDYNGDGALDLFIHGDDGAGAPVALLYRNDGTGTLLPADVAITGRVSGPSADWGDFNGDGRLDLAINGGSSEGATATVYRNDGSNVFTPLDLGLTGTSAGAIRWGDFNSDGRYDLAITGDTNGPAADGAFAALYRNDGNEQFVPLNAGLTGARGGSAEWGDFNADGRPDLVVSGDTTDAGDGDTPDGRSTTLYRNDGDGLFTALDIGLTATGGSATWTDANGDGALDILVTGLDAEGTPQTTLFRNGVTPLTRTPGEINYGRRGLADSLTQTVTVANGGTLSREVLLSLEDGTAFSIEGTASRTIAPGTSIDVEVTFAPPEAATWSDRLLVVAPTLPPASDTLAVGLTGRGITVNVNEPPLTVSAGESATVTVQIPEDLDPTEATLFYRETGAPVYQSLSFDVGGPGSETAVSIPGDVATERGIEYYVEVREVRSSELPDIRVTFPSVRPSRSPARIRTQVPTVEAKGTFQSRTYRMISVPLDLAGRTVSEVFTAQYGPYDAEALDAWRLLRYDPDAARYRPFPELQDAPIDPGAAYWLITAEGDSLTVSNGTSVEAAAPDTLRLRPEWNQIGTPFAFPVAWEDVVGSSAVDPPVAYDGTQPSGEEYQYGVQVLEPWQGYFVYNPTGEPLSLAVPPVEATSENEAPTGSAARTAASQTPSGAYRLQLHAALDTGDEVLRDRQNWIGFAPTANGSRTVVPEAPPIGKHVRLSIQPDDGPRLAQSLKPTGRAGQHWDVTVSAQVEEAFFTEKTVTLTFAETGTLPDGFQRYVLDLSDRSFVPTRGGAATVRLTKAHPTRHLRVILGTESMAETVAHDIPLQEIETTLHAPAPNPMQGSTTLTYAVKEQTSVRIEVYDVLGRRIRTLVDQTRCPGQYTVTWNAGANSGSVASGMYFIRMEAGTETVTRKLVVAR